MTEMLFKISRIAVLLLGFSVMIYVSRKGYYPRAVMELIMIFVFLGVSVLYERKRKIFSVGYIFLTVILFITYNLAPCYFIKENLMKRMRIGVQVPHDHFFLYFTIYMLCMGIIAIGLFMKKTTKLPIKRDFAHETDIEVLLMSLFCLFITINSGLSMALLYAPAFCYAFFKIKISNYQIKPSVLFMLAGGVAVIFHFMIYRYVIVEYILPIIIGYLLLESYTDRARPIKIICLLLFGVVVIGLYGVISEIAKLNYFFNGKYNIQVILRNVNEMGYFIENQIYRLFGIWTVLGGNIIEYAQENGYFYGITFIKVLAPAIGFPYVSLPIISANMVGASYAQPGLLAEGYANLGIIGSVINLIVPYMIAEWYLDYFLSKRTLFSVCLLAIPFSKVLLDGGSINSIIAGSIMCLIVFFLERICHQFKIKLNCNMRFRGKLKWN